MNILQCHSKGDKRFSALYAKVTIDRKTKTIEEFYQDCKRDKNGNKVTKGKKVSYMEFRNIKLPSYFLSQFYDFSAAEKCVLFLTVGLVLALELVNTAVEKAVDLYTQKDEPFAKAAKDTAAGAVLISAIAAVCVAAVLFWDAAVILEIAAFVTIPYVMAGVIVLAVLSVIFIFKGI